MKIKKRLKHKSCLPKATFGLDASNRNKELADSASDIANAGLGFLTSFSPKDNNDGIGISHQGSAISKGITSGLHAGANVAKAIPGIGTIVGGAMDAAATIGDFITGLVDNHKENDRTQTSRLARKTYDPTYANTNYSFGVPQGKYGLPLFKSGGNPIYTSDPNDPRLKAYNDSLYIYNKFENFNRNNDAYKENKSRIIPYKNKNPFWDLEFPYIANIIEPYYSDSKLKKIANKINPVNKKQIQLTNDDNATSWSNYRMLYKKPVQPVILQKEVGVPEPKVNFLNNIPLQEEMTKKDLLGVIQHPENPENKQPFKGNYFYQKRPNGGFNVYQNGKRVGYSPTQQSKDIRPDEDSYDLSKLENGGTLAQPKQKLDFDMERLARKTYDPTYANTNYSFGVPQGKYGLPLFKSGGNPIYTSDPNDPRLKSYQDSLYNYNIGQKMKGILNNDKNLMPAKPGSPIDVAYNKSVKKAGNKQIDNSSFEHGEYDNYKKIAGIMKEYQEKGNKGILPIRYQTYWPNPDNAAIDLVTARGFLDAIGVTKSRPGASHIPQWKKPEVEVKLNTTLKNTSAKKTSKTNSSPKKPIQPVVLQKEVAVPEPKVNFLKNLSQEEKQQIDILGNNVQYNNEPATQTTQELKGKPLNDFLKQERRNPNGGINTYIRKDIKSPWIQQDFALGGPIQQKNYMNSFNTELYKSIDNIQERQQILSQPFINSQTSLNTPIINYNTNAKNIRYKKNNMFDSYMPLQWSFQFELGGDPRDQANIEAEQGEAMLHSSGKVENIGGKKHEDGGTPLQVKPNHEYIFSDSLGFDKNGNITINEKSVKKSFADKAKSIERKYSGREGDRIVHETKEFELNNLKQQAEQARVAKEELEMGKQIKKYKAKYGMALKQFDNSGYVFDQNNYIDWIKKTPEYNDFNFDLGSDKAKAVFRPMYAEHIYDTEGADAYNTVVSTFNNKPGGYTVGKDGLENTSYSYPGGSFTTKTTGSQGQGIAFTNPFGGGFANNAAFIGPRPYTPRDMNRYDSQIYQPGMVKGSTPITRATASMDQRSTAPEVAGKVKSGMFDNLTAGDKMQLASMIPAFGFNMGMGLQKPEVEPNRKNKYENDVLNIMSNRKFDIQNYLNEANMATNVAREDIGNNSTSVGGKMANLQKLYANSLGNLANITTKGQEMNNQYRAEEANTKNILGEANRAESIRAAGINDQNRARKQQFLAKAMEQLGQGIATTGQASNQSLINKLLIKSLSEISPDFDIKSMKDMQVDNDGYIVFKGVKTEFKMSDEGKIVMVSGTPNTANAAKSQYAPKDFTMKAFANFTKTKTKG